MKILNISTSDSGFRIQKGAALVSMIGVIVVMGVVGTSVVSMTRSSEHSHLTANAGSRAHFLAESGLEFAQTIYDQEGWLHGRERTLALQGGGQVDVIRLEDTFWANALIDAGTVKEGRALLPKEVRLSEESDVNPPSENPSMSDYVIFGDESFELKNQLLVVGDVGMINRNIDMKGELEGNLLGHDIDFTAHGDVAVETYACVDVNVYASGFVDIHVGEVEGDVHSEEGVMLRSSNATVAGWVFSKGDVTLGGGSQVRGHVHSTSGDVNLGASVNIGTPAEPVEVRASGDVILSGSAKIYGKVYAGGSITGASGIVGDAYAGGAISGAASGQTTANAASFLKLPIAPDLRKLDGLTLPPPANFWAYGYDVTIQRASAVTVAPGTYSNLYTPRNARGACLYLRAGASDHGNYYFNSVTMGNNMNLFFDLSGSHDIRIFVKNNIEVASDMNTYVSTDGYYYYPINHPFVNPELAKRIYWETHCDFLIQRNRWFGTVYTPYGIIDVDSGSHLTGSYYSGGGHNLKGGTVKYQRSNYLSGEPTESFSFFGSF